MLFIRRLFVFQWISFFCRHCFFLLKWIRMIGNSRLIKLLRFLGIWTPIFAKLLGLFVVYAINIILTRLNAFLMNQLVIKLSVVVPYWNGLSWNLNRFIFIRDFKGHWVVDNCIFNLFWGLVVLHLIFI